MVFCRNCGAQMDDDQLYCIKCGTASQFQVQQQAPPAPQSAPSQPTNEQTEQVAPAPQTQYVRQEVQAPVCAPVPQPEKVKLKGGWLALSIINIILSLLLFIPLFWFFDTIIPLALIALGILGLVFTATAANRPKRVAKARLKVAKIMNIIGISINGLAILVAVVIALAIIVMIILGLSIGSMDFGGSFDSGFIYEGSQMFFRF